MFLFLLRSLVFIFTASTLLSAHAAAEKDRPGSKDHPLLLRVPGYYINDYDQKDFEVFDMKLWQDGKPATPFHAEGKVTKIGYRIGKGLSTPSCAAVQMNYRRALEQIGAARLPSKRGCSHLYPDVYQLKQEGVNTYVVVEMPNDDGENYRLTIVEAAPLLQVVTANAAALYDALKKDGFVPLYLNFETNQAGLRPDAQGTIKEIVTLLKNNPDLKLSIEGHTDNVGDPKSNKILSEARANTVMKEVIKQGIDGKRLVAEGFGQEHPVADNRREDGRAKNRRVELVRK